MAGKNVDKWSSRVERNDRRKKNDYLFLSGEFEKYGHRGIGG